MSVYGLSQQSQQPVPLRSISVDLAVRGFVADVVLELHYQNEEKAAVEAVFVFPLDDDAAVYALEGLIGGTRIEARIQEKEKAEQVYEDALVEGHQAFLLQREAEASDVFSCSLGNLPPGGEATLKLRYIQTLAPDPDGAVRFILPTVTNPCYEPWGLRGAFLTQSISRLPRGDLPYSLSLRATLESPYAIKSIESNCTFTLLNYTAQDHTSAQVSLADTCQFDQDVELLIYYKEPHKPSALLEPGKVGAVSGSLMGDPALLLMLYPNLPAYKRVLNTTREFIFLLDRYSSACNNNWGRPNSPSGIRRAKDLQSLKTALQPAVTGISLHWDLPSGLEAKVVGSGPQVFFKGQHCLIYAQILGQRQSAGATEGTVELQYTFQDQTIKETMKFPLQAQESVLLPVHLFAALTLLKEQEGAEEEEKQRLALETSLSSRVVCSQMAYVGVNTELGKPLQEEERLLVHQLPGSLPARALYRKCITSPRNTGTYDRIHGLRLCPERKASIRKEKGSSLLRLVSLQNADGSWTLDTALASLLGLSEAEVTMKTPDKVVSNAWAMVLAILWVHSSAAAQIDEWQLSEAKALHWLQATAGLVNALLGSSMNPRAVYHRDLLCNPEIPSTIVTWS